MGAAASYLHNRYRAGRFRYLGEELFDRYGRTGQVDDLNQAIHYFGQAIEAASHNHRAAYFRNLGLGLRARYERTGQFDDIRQALQYFVQAINITPKNHPDRALLLQYLGVTLHGRYLRTLQVDDLDQAIQFLQQAMDATPDNHPRRADRFQNLGVVLLEQYRRTGLANDLDQVIQYYQQGIDITSDRYPGRAFMLRNLGAAIRDRYRRTDQIDDLDQAIQYFQQAIDLAPDNHPDRARLFDILGTGLHDRYKRLGHMSDLINSTKNHKIAFQDAFGLPPTCINSGISAVTNLVEQKKWKDSAQIIERILQLLPQVVLPTGSRHDLQHALKTFAGVASSAASILLKAGEPPLVALQALERCRGIIASIMIDARSDISDLKDQYPQLWSRYTECRDHLASLNFTSKQDSYALDLGTKSNERQRLAKALNDLQIEIRQRPGFERFLLPPTEQEFRNMAQDGSLVCFNVSDISSEAFLVTTEGIQVLNLPDFNVDNVLRGVKLFAARGNPTRRDASLYESDEEEEEENPSTLDVPVELFSLWKHAVRPVLNRLGLLGQKGATHSLSRIWWVGGGAMTIMPLHAAGDHKLGSTENTISHVISSYASTFKSLQFVRDKRPFSILNSDSKQEILIVSMPVTPNGHSPLKVSREVTAIQRQSKSWALIRHLDRPGRDSVVNALESCNIAHFACHAEADRIRGTKSSLLLGRDVLEKLTLEDMDTISHGQAQIAYLSACATAGFQNQADESVHIASAFQLAGFPHVIGTLWGADDDAAVEIASNFYQGLNLFDRGGRGLVAQALHYAVIRYRNEQDNGLAVMKWAPFVHIGC